MGLRPASPERRGTHRYTFVGTNMESLLGGFRAPRVQSTVGGKNCKHPHPTPEQDSTQTRPTVGSGFKPLPPLTWHPWGCFLHKTPLSLQSVGC